MSLASDIHTAINTVWDNSGLDWEFKKLWDADERDDDEALCEMEAAPENPSPYTEYSVEAPDTSSRMSADSGEGRREIQDAAIQFIIHVQKRSNDSRTAKDTAIHLANFIIQKFGGHPTVKPQKLVLATGAALILQKQSDYGVREGDEEYSWVINYIARCDVPVAA